MIKFNMKGGEAVHKLLQQLPVEVETKILRNGLSAGARVLRDEARSRVPSKTGALRASIKTSRNTNKTEGQVVAKVRLKGKHSFLGNFIEYGVAAHQIWVRGDKQTLLINGVAIGKQVWHPGIAPQPFMRPALDARGGDAVQVVGEYLTRYLQWGTISAPEVAVDLEDAD